MHHQRERLVQLLRTSCQLAPGPRAHAGIQYLSWDPTRHERSAAMRRRMVRCYCCEPGFTLFWTGEELNPVTSMPHQLEIKRDKLLVLLTVNQGTTDVSKQRVTQHMNK